MTNGHQYSYTIQCNTCKERHTAYANSPKGAEKAARVWLRKHKKASHKQ